MKRKQNRLRVVDNVCYLKLLNRKGNVVGEAIVDAEDYHKVKGECFCLHYPMPKYSYFRVISGKGKKLHQIILGVSPKNMVIDHINGNNLDNRKCNLRFITHSQNCWNRGKHYIGTSKYKGVHYEKSRNKYVTQIKVYGERKFYKRFNTELEAARAYNVKAKELFGEYAVLNNV